MPPGADTASEQRVGMLVDPGAPDPTLTFEGRSLGSALRLGVTLPGSYDPGAADATAARAWTAVLAEFDAVDRSLSRFRADSELTRLNRLAGSGVVTRVSRRLRVALATIDRAARVTGGRFDATVLEDLERLGEHGADLGGPAAAGAPVAAVDAAMRTWPVHAPPVPLDTGGIGKGLALRWGAAVALATLPPGAGILLEAGGDIVQAGRLPTEGCRIGIEDPAGAPGGADGRHGPGDHPGTGDPAPPIVVLDLHDGAVATSSVRVRNWVGPDGRAVHHLVDPRTREPARTGLIAVTVATADPAWAEVWTKALFVGGRDAIGDEARARGLAAWWVDDRGRLGMTPEARVRTIWAAEDRLG